MIQQRIAERGQWTAALLDLPEPHVLQTWQWGEVKRQTGWQPTRLLWREETTGAPVAAASLLLRRIPRLPRGVAYVPKGPLLDWTNEQRVDAVLAAIELEARRQGAIFVKIDPDVSPDSLAGPFVKDALQRRGWRPSPEQIQFRNTALLDLTPDEDALLEAMKPKWRYNIRLAERRGVIVRRGTVADLPAFYALYRETGGRDGFIVRPFDYYEETWRTFMQPADADAPAADLLLAEVEGEAVAGLILFRFGERAWYMYGASSERQRAAMPNHLLQWEAMRLARAAGCTVYDLWGAPDTLDESDGMWGVWRFKEGFGARFAPHIGAWDYPVSSTQYRLYTDAMPRVLDLMRRRHRARSANLQGLASQAGGKVLQSGRGPGGPSSNRRLPLIVHRSPFPTPERPMFRFLFGLVIGATAGFVLAKLSESMADQNRLREARDEAIQYRAQMAAARQSETVASAPAPTPTPAPPAPVQNDDLTRINGIGPVFQSRLREAGLRTYAQLAAADAETVRAAVAAADWQKIEPERWIEEAAQLAAA